MYSNSTNNQHIGLLPLVRPLCYAHHINELALSWYYHDITITVQASFDICTTSYDVRYLVSCKLHLRFSKQEKLSGYSFFLDFPNHKSFLVPFFCWNFQNKKILLAPFFNGAACRITITVQPSSCLLIFATTQSNITCLPNNCTIMPLPCPACVSQMLKYTFPKDWQSESSEIGLWQE